MGLRRIGAVALLLVGAPLLSACDTTGAAGDGGKGGPPGTGASVGLYDMPKPGTSPYTCGDGSRVTIQNLGSSVRVFGADGMMEEDLPASPPNQTSRFGADHDAIVLDGNDALIMKSGARPVSCTR